MFNLKFLHQIRRAEISTILGHFGEPPLSILEIGGGTGEQAKILSNIGYDVTSIDVEGSNYASDRVYPVMDYDGKTIPFENEKFDIVFSSNVLEHILDIGDFQEEMMRVLRPGGKCVHLMPTGSWTFWTGIAHFFDIPARIRSQLNEPELKQILEGAPDQNLDMVSSTTAPAPLRVFHLIKKLLARNAGYILPRRHGERYCLLIEIFTFSSLSWRIFFARKKVLVKVCNGGLFYTGYMVLGQRLSLPVRRILSYIFGSAIKIYIVKAKV